MTTTTATTTTTTTLSCHHGDGLALGGVDLAWHDGAAGLILRQRQLSQATAGAGAKESDIIGNLHDGAGNDIAGTRHLHHGVMAGQSLKLVRSCDKWQSSELGNLGSNLNTML